VVDDSALIRQILTRALSVDPRIEVVGTAGTGVEAIEKARALTPDVITLDIEMPELSGLEALPHLIKHSDARIVMLSSVDDPDTTYRALELGAIDFIPKPGGGFASSITELSEVVIKKIRTAYRINPRTARDGAYSASASSHTGEGIAQGRPRSLVAVAASTGGPPALERLFAGLEAGISAAYFIVQHLPPGFSASLANRLDRISEVVVVQAQDGMTVEAGHAYVAPSGFHMRVHDRAGKLRIVMEDSPPLHGVRPAADPLFSSVARVAGPDAVGVVLSGMGSDGAMGSVEIAASGGVTIVQDERTSVVWGMPGSVVRANAASVVVPVGLVAAEVRRATRSGVPA